MDTTKDYIDKCEKAVKIQDIYFDVEDFRPLLPSFVYDKTLQRVCIHIWIPSKMSIEWDNDGNIERPEGGESYKKKAIWLPKQDQLQAMVSKPKHNALDSMFLCYKTMDDIASDWGEQTSPFWSSMEQLWLAFVMHENYGKHWKVSSWEK